VLKAVPVLERPGHLVFACGAALYAVPADTASEVVSVPSLTRVPGAPSHLLGVFAHRGELLPVIDLARLVGQAAGDGSKRAVLVRTPKGPVALCASRVLGVSALEGALHPLGDVGVRRHLRGPARSPGGEVAVIDTQTFVDFLSTAG
jgi:purine-binding chemotaxis protein CheW